MKHLFIINPVAGGKNANAAAVSDRISGIMTELGEEFELYTTTAPLDAYQKVREEAGKFEPLRIYACGGDGTLNECVNGAAGAKHAAVTSYPSGTGNDFIRMFGDEKDGFFDLKRLVHGDVHPVDVLDMNGRRVINICSVGIDARIGVDVHKYSRLPLIGGAAGYVASLAVNIFKGINTQMTVRTGGHEFSGRFALMCACNGRYYGGGFNPVPDAIPNDGLMDILLVNEVSVIQFLYLVKKYAAGKYTELGRFVTHIRSGYLELEAPERFVVNVDGEAVWSDHMRLSLIPGGINMFFPSGMRFFDVENKQKLVK